MKINNLEKTVGERFESGDFGWIKKLLMHKGVEIFLVGGAVRDLLLGREVKDFDFVVRGLEIKKLETILAQMGRVELVGKNFGVFKFVPKIFSSSNLDEKILIDVALPRKEISLATGGYRDFKVQFDDNIPIEEDLGRRDFTINALAYNLKTKELVDEFGGMDDLNKKIIRTVGNAYERFEEDYSRMLRGIRFACQLKFRFDNNTWAAIEKLICHINDQRIGYDSKFYKSVRQVGGSNLSKSKKKTKESEARIVPLEIIAGELLKAFVANPVKAFDLYDKSGAFQELMPEVLKMKGCPQPEEWHSEGDVWNHVRLCLFNLGSKAFVKRFKNQIIFDSRFEIRNPKFEINSKLLNVELVMAVLLHDVGKPETIQTPEEYGTDRLRFNGHDDLSAKMAVKISERLKLSAAPEFEFDPERVSWLIARHHLFDTQTIKSMKNSTIEKYFFNDRFSGEDLLKLGFVDMLSSIRKKTGEGDMENFEFMVRRINELKRMGKGKRLPEPFLNGDEVMKILKINPGEKVGKVLEDLREKQLSGEIRNKREAISSLKNTEELH